MTKEKSRKTKVFLLTIFIVLSLIVFSPIAIVVTGELWALNTNTVVLDNTSHNVNIGKNATTTYQLEINGNVYVNGSIDTNTGNDTNWDKAFSWGNHSGLYALLNHWHNDTYFTRTELQQWMPNWNASASGNPFDQWLNTTDNVTFNDLTVTNDTTVRNIYYDNSGNIFNQYAGNNDFMLWTNQIKASIIMENTGEISFPYQSACRVRLTNTQSVSSNTWTRLLLNYEIYDQNNDFANYRFVAPASGVYSVTYSVGIYSITNGYFVESGIYKNGLLEGGYENNYATGTQDLFNSGASCFYLSVNDYLELYVYHNVFLANKFFSVQTYTNYMTVTKIT